MSINKIAEFMNKSKKNPENKFFYKFSLTLLVITMLLFGKIRKGSKNCD